jgi:transposase
MANGTAPLEASSGRVRRYRLNRGGNRPLNKAIHIAATTQISRPHTEGRRYYYKRLAYKRLADGRPNAKPSPPKHQPC